MMRFACQISCDRKQNQADDLVAHHMADPTHLTHHFVILRVIWEQPPAKVTQPPCPSAPVLAQ